MHISTFVWTEEHIWKSREDQIQNAVYHLKGRLQSGASATFGRTAEAEEAESKSVRSFLEFRDIFDIF